MSVEEAQRIAGLGRGFHYRSTEWLMLAECVDWDDLWPTVDRHGSITGAVVGSEEGHLNVDDEAMMPFAECAAAEAAGEWVGFDGYIVFVGDRNGGAA